MALRTVIFIMVVFAAFQSSATYYEDALRIEDDFGNASGIDAAISSTFVNLGDRFQATQATSSISSLCLAPPPPVGETLERYGFVDVLVARQADVSNTLVIEDCQGNELSRHDLVAGCNLIDISLIDASVNPGLVFRYEAEHSGVPNAQNAAEIDGWSLYARSSNAVTLDVNAPASDESAQDVVIEIPVGANGAQLRNAEVRVSLDELNDLLDGANDNGRAEDAQNDYGNGLLTHRPITFVSAATGPAGEVPQVPSSGATGGEIVWTLDDQSSGNTFTLSVTLHVPNGYIAGKRYALSATLSDHDVSTCDASVLLDESTSVVGDAVVVSSPDDWNFRQYTPFSNVAAGAEDVRSTFFWQNIGAEPSHQSDLENVEVTLTSIGTCPAIFDRLVGTGGVPSANIEVTSGHVSGDTFDAANPVTLRITRIHNEERNRGFNVYYDASPTCAPNAVPAEFMKINAEVTAANPAFTASASSVNVTIVTELCRRGFSHAHRAQAGEEIGNAFNPWPGWPEYYNPDGAISPGQFFSTWMPYGNAGHRTQTVVLDQSYFLTQVPAGTTFHGFQRTNNTSRVYKDCTGNGLSPDDENFAHGVNVDPQGWSPVSLTFNGPFSDAPDQDDPDAVVQQECRLLVIKDGDSPADVAPDNGNWRPVGIYRVCDGQNGCDAPADQTHLAAISGQIFTRFQNTTSVCANVGGYRWYVTDASYPHVHAEALNASVPSGQSAKVQLNPENRNRASQPTEGQWGFNLFEVRDFIDLALVSGEVIDGAVPLGGDTAAIVFMPPDAAACMAALSDDDPACFAYWDVPTDTQPVNAFGKRIATDQNFNEYQQSYVFELSAPIKLSTPADTLLPFRAEVRTRDLTTLGVDNLPLHENWPADNFNAIAEVVALEVPSVTGDLSAPSSVPRGNTFSVSGDVTNAGNAPNKGVFGVIEMPLLGVNGSEFNPNFQRMYFGAQAASLIVERSQDSNCFSNPNAATFSPLALRATTRPGFASESIDPLQSADRCIRFRQSVAAAPLQPGQRITYALDLEIPDDEALLELVVQNRALVGASILFGATSEVPGAETESTQTIVRVEVDLAVDVTSDNVVSDAGRIVFGARVSNRSGLDSEQAALTLDIPNDTIFDGFDQLPAGIECVPLSCAPQNTNADGSGGTITLTMGSLSADDGAPGIGNDEVELLYSVVITDAQATPGTATSCLRAVPTPAGVIGNDCQDVALRALSVSKSFELNPDFGGSPELVTGGMPIRFTLVAQNNDTVALSATVVDVLAQGLALVPGSIRIDGATASDALFSGNILSYTHSPALLPGEQIEVIFDAEADIDLSVTSLENIALLSACVQPADRNTCAPAVASAPVEFLINQAPFAQNQNYEVLNPSTNTFNVLVGASDPSDDALTLVDVGATSAQGNVTLDGDRVLYTPAAGFYGTETFQYTIDDGRGASASATVTVVVNQCNNNTQCGSDAPQCNVGISPRLCEVVCGDGLVSPGELCDDANVANGDGCDSLCTIEAGYTCQGEPSVCETTCSDGIVAGAEECDDGNANSQDGCDSSCIIEAGFVCVGAPSQCAAAQCGDGLVAGDEGCDDGALVAGDGCSPDCQVEEGWTCGGEPSVCEAGDCGDSIVAGVEGCDDGNTLDDDGCSSNCAAEPGFVCTGVPSRCESTCGDGLLAANEACDDSNLIASDGCDSQCAIEEGFVCQGVPSECDSLCGDGIVTANEGCDDGNASAEDGCDAECVIEEGYVCEGVPSNCETLCGDGVVFGDEVCDDGNSDDDDGCTSNCLLGNDETCTDDAECDTNYCDDETNRCGPEGRCGDARLDGGEGCDDGNVENGDGCDDNCLIEYGWVCQGEASACSETQTCGDGVTTPSEACDDHNLVNGDGCDDECKLEPGERCDDASECASGACVSGACSRCGNGIIDAGEGCDDGNDDDNDACTNTCLIKEGLSCVSSLQCQSALCDLSSSGLCAQPASTCGDGNVDLNEGCDDGNNVVGDGCTACLLDVGETCMADDRCSSSLCVNGICSACGNGFVDVGEGCDDGNTNADDGCNAACKIEDNVSCQSDDQCAGGYCDYGADEEEPLCTSVVLPCGNGIVEAGEGCDDGNREGGDGCDVSCLVEDGNVCESALECASASCSEGICVRCGDGDIDAQEACDDANTLDGDGCSSACRVEVEGECTALRQCESGACDLDTNTCLSPCGDGSVDEGEGCDDSNLDEGDGCNAACLVEEGFACAENDDCASGLCYEDLCLDPNDDDDDDGITNGVEVEDGFDPFDPCDPDPEHENCNPADAGPLPDGGGAGDAGDLLNADGGVVVDGGQNYSVTGGGCTCKQSGAFDTAAIFGLLVFLGTLRRRSAKKRR